jgi:hypothetical protein
MTLMHSEQLQPRQPRMVLSNTERRVRARSLIAMLSPGRLMELIGQTLTIMGPRLIDI